MTGHAQGAIAKVLVDIATDGGLSGVDIANAVDVSKATVSRWKSGLMRPQPRHELILSDLRYVVGRLQEFYTTEEVRLWLYARHPQLDGQRAIDLIHDDRTGEVLAILERLESGVYL
jgi:uncharacterized protein (DUF2384 family)